MKKTAKDYLDEYEENLKKVLAEEGVIMDIDIILCKPKIPRERSQEAVFLAAFNGVKSATIKGAKGHKSLSEVAKRNLSRLVKRGFTEEDYRHATEAMYYGEWAVSTGNDNPTHLLREGNFERYLNLWEKKHQEMEEEKRMAVEKGELAKKDTESWDNRIEQERREWEREAKEVYYRSIASGEWLGTPFHATYLYDLITLTLPEGEDAELLRLAARHADIGQYKQYPGLTEQRVYKDLIVSEAVIQKIQLCDPK